MITTLIFGLLVISGPLTKILAANCPTVFQDLDPADRLGLEVLSWQQRIGVPGLSSAVAEGLGGREFQPAQSNNVVTISPHKTGSCPVADGVRARTSAVAANPVNSN